MNNKTRTHRADVRLNDTEYHILQDAQAKYGVSKSKLLRTLVYFYRNSHQGKIAMRSAINQARTPEKHASKLFSACSDVITQANDDKDIIAPIANNFNQLVRKVNGGKRDFANNDEKLIFITARAVKRFYSSDIRNRNEIIEAMNEIRKGAD